MNLKLSLATALAALALTSTAALANTGTTTGSVNMRVGPGTQHAVIVAIPTNQNITVVGCAASSWCEVVWGGHRGWVSASYITHPGGATVTTVHYDTPDVVVIHEDDYYNGALPRADARQDARVENRVDRRMDRRWDHWTGD